ncbi:hypothetical protein LIER_32072 [Lithospermum erythrorhizon]|uniref:Uncharacterized protein n=1 Tax=Lithospermum erythrorhizon TaxID=34254 RepID=A0AAV3RV12_LITER
MNTLAAKISSMKGIVGATRLTNMIVGFSSWFLVHGEIRVDSRRRSTYKGQQYQDEGARDSNPFTRRQQHVDRNLRNEVVGNSQDFEPSMGNRGIRIRSYDRGVEDNNDDHQFRGTKPADGGGLGDGETRRGSLQVGETREHLYGDTHKKENQPQPLVVLRGEDSMGDDYKFTFATGVLHEECKWGDGGKASLSGKRTKEMSLGEEFSFDEGYKSQKLTRTHTKNYSGGTKEKEDENANNNLLCPGECLVEGVDTTDQLLPSKGADMIETTINRVEVADPKRHQVIRQGSWCGTVDALVSP